MDRLTLLLAALALAIVVLGGAFLIETAHLDESWSTLWIITVIYFVAVFVSWMKLIRARRKTLYRYWPLTTAWILLLFAHIAVLGSIMTRYHPDWQMSHWLVIGWLELMILAIVLESAYYVCVRPTWRSWPPFRFPKKGNQE